MGRKVTGVARVAPALLPFALDLVDVVQAPPSRLCPLGGEADEPGPAVGWVGPAVDPAAALEGGDQLAHRLVGHVGARREVAEARPSWIDVLEDRVVCRLDPAVAVALEPFTSSSTMSRAVRRKAIITVKGRSSYAAIGCLVALTECRVPA